jgi:quercetin dioxygenase-like cupin family protein
MSTQLINTNPPYALPAGGGKPMSWFASSIHLKASCAEVGIVEVSISPGEEPPLHVHKNEDEWFYVLDGEVTFHVGNENYRASVGGFVSFPRGIPHTFTVESPNARFLVMNTPGGFEHMFELAPKTIEDAVSALKAFDIEVVGPHPRQATAA